MAEWARAAITRWLDLLGDTPVTRLFTLEDAGTASYLADRKGASRAFHWFTGEDREAQIKPALRAQTFNDETIVFMAGEATSLILLRHYLRRELVL